MTSGLTYPHAESTRYYYLLTSVRALVSAEDGPGYNDASQIDRLTLLDYAA
ncbi:hypothetical protein [Pseudomonas mandelii]|uniref:hypothetical protein n=1 Tax=Pseudomonas mandelii TaxID=75612 RepID=UPI0003670802|nr:hypothetical protein [Pseudomonas mandelii]